MTVARIGVIGAGHIGVQHAEAWRRIGVDLHVHSRDPRRRTETAARCAARAHERLETLLDAVDVVDVCTPTDTHGQIALAAAAAGRHVICEKPLARTLDTADGMIDACRAAGVWLLPAHVVRYYPAYARAAKLAADLRPVTLTLHRASTVPDWAGWLHEPDRSGGILCDFMIHDLDAARWIAGEVVEVTAVAVPTGGPLPRHGRPVEARVSLRHVTGASSRVSGSWLAPPARFRTSFEVAGAGGVLRHDSDRGGRLALLDAGGRSALLGGGATSGEPLTTQLAEFLHVIRNGAAPRVTAEDGRAALAIALAAIESASSGRPVAPDTG